MTISQLVNVVIDAAESKGEALSALTIEERIFADYPAEVEAEARDLARRQIRAIAQTRLSSRTRAREESLPGLGLPRWLSRSADGGGAEAFVPLKSATVADFDAHIAVRQENYNECGVELRSLRAIRRRIPADVAADALLVDVLAPKAAS